MDNLPAARAYLESLTTAELIKMADNYGIDIPPELDRIFIIEELLDLVSLNEPDSISDEFPLAGEPETAVSTIKEPVPLPKQYNITFIEVMIRDPLWAFVFWEVRAADKEQFEKSQDFGGYYLKVSPLDNQAASSPRGEGDGVFTVPVKPEDSAWYLGLSPVIGNGNFPEESRYKVELCAGMKGGETVVASSVPFDFPGLSELPAGVAANPFVHLSGYGDFHVIRSGERTLRAKRGVSAGTL